MTMRILRRKRLHSHHELVQVLTVLDRIQILIMHTCVHGEHPVTNLKMAKHIEREIHELIENLNELSDEISEIGYTHPEAYKRLKKALHELKEILDDLHDGVHEILSSVPAGSTTHAPALDNIRALLRKACPDLEKEYDEVVEDIYEMGLITHDLKSTHTL